jgi:P-type Mg2+ transporter
VVVATGGDAEFGRIALGLGERQPETEFQVGLRKFSMLLVQVAGVLTTAIFVINVVLHKPVIDALLFSLAIAVGISPQLLPAVVSTSLAAGSRQLARRKVLVKRLVCIEDLGDVDVLFTDKTGTLTEGSLQFMRAAGPGETSDDEILLLGLLCNEAVVANGRAVGGNPLDVALWESPAAGLQRAELARYSRLSILPFDHERRLVSVLTQDDRGQRVIITKGAPEGLLARCVDVPDTARASVQAEFAAGNRVIGVAVKDASGQSSITPADEQELRLAPTLTKRVASSASYWRELPYSPGSAPSTRLCSCVGSGARASAWPSWATGSTTPWHCTPPMWESRSTRPPTSPRMPPTCCYWKRTFM